MQTLPPITQKQQDIIFLIARFRFLNRNHIQQFLTLSDHKRTNLRLKYLTTKNYLNRSYSTNFHEKNKPALYHLTQESVHYLKAHSNYPSSYLRSLSRDSERTPEFIAKSLFLADIALNVATENQHGHTDESLLYVPFSAADVTVSSLTFLTEISPDLVLIKKKGTGQPTYLLLYLITEKMPKPTLRKILRAIATFFWSGAWEDQMDSVFPTVLFASETEVLLTRKLVMICLFSLGSLKRLNKLGLFLRFGSSLPQKNLETHV
jgi:hypothetical protein